MFAQTYGVLYDQNKIVFADLFRDLTRYYISGEVPLDERLKEFYNTLYRRVFQLLNKHHYFDDRYWICIEEKTKTQKPFGNIPHKMTQGIRRAFVAARSFVQALATGREVVQNMMRISPVSSCDHGLMRMLYCSHCSGELTAKPCGNFCLNVIKGCLAYHVEMEQVWNQYLGKSFFIFFLRTNDEFFILIAKRIVKS